MSIYYYNYGGGGGAGGAGGGTNNGGAGGIAAGSIGTADFLYNFNGAQGFGGTAAGPGWFGYSADASVDGVGSAGYGGYAGGYGQPGTTGTTGSGYPILSPQFFGSPGTSGSGGTAITGASLISWDAVGTVAGNLSSWGTWTGGGSNFLGLMAGHITPAKETLATSGAWNIKLGTRWYWNAYNAGQVGQPATTLTFYIPVTNKTGSSITAHVYGLVDNVFTTLNVNGSVVAVGPAFGFTTPAQTNNFTLVPGINVIAVSLTNSPVSIAGFNLRIRKTSDNSVLAGPMGWFY